MRHSSRVRSAFHLANEPPSSRIQVKASPGSTLTLRAVQDADCRSSSPTRIASLTDAYRALRPSPAPVQFARPTSMPPPLALQAGPPSRNLGVHTPANRQDAQSKPPFRGLSHSRSLALSGRYFCVCLGRNHFFADHLGTGCIPVLNEGARSDKASSSVWGHPIGSHFAYTTVAVSVRNHIYPEESPGITSVRPVRCWAKNRRPFARVDRLTLSAPSTLVTVLKTFHKVAPGV